MTDIEKFLGVQNLSGSPFSSASFLAASVLGLTSIVTAAYLTYRLWDTSQTFAALVFAIPMGLQLVYQWCRVLKCRAKIREIYAKDFSAGIEGSCVDVAVHVALRGLIDLLFFSYGVTMLALILIEFLLRSTIR